MCGIAGIVRSGRSSLAPPEMTALVEAMDSTIAHRGPDANGVWSDPAGRCVLGHLRLAIIDTSPAGRQPMATGDGRWQITFNGELYNFQEIRPALQAAGIALRGRTDTEVLIESIALWGTEAFTRFDGQFALGAFDTLSGELLLARDPFGEKPLYYMELPAGDFAFASELQALERLPGFDATVDIDAVAEVLSFQYIGAPRTIYGSVRKLPPAHWLRRDANGKITTGRYYQFRPGLSGFSDRPMNDLADELEDILTRSIRRRLIADVPLGAFLSGGVDSSTVCALVRRKLGLPIMTFSTGFEGAPESEHLTARAFAEHLGTDHHEEILTPNAADFLLHAGQYLDEPNGDSSCLPTYLLSRFARRHVTVAVSGDGGDELFGGYGRYFATCDELALRRRGGLPSWSPGGAYYGSRILIMVEQQLADLFGFVPAKFAAHLGRLRGEIDGAQDRLLCEMRRSDVDNYMPGAVLAKVDRMSMQHALEVRTPYLSTELAGFAERLPDTVLLQNGRGKRILREVAYRYLPRELIDLPKQGFALPMSDWARTSLLDTASKLVEGDDGRLRAMFGAERVNGFMRRQQTQGQFSAYQMWSVAMLESWLRHHPVKLPSLVEQQARARADSTVAALASRAGATRSSDQIETSFADSRVSPADPTLAPRRLTVRSVAGFTLKLAVTAACLWYASRSISLADFLRLASTTSPLWVAVSVLMMVIQIPLIGLRWCKIVDALAGGRAPRKPLMAITAIGVFFGQVAPNVVGDSMRVWLLTRLGRSWREGLISVLIDRGVGVGVLLAITFCVLLFPSGLTALGGHRALVLAIIGALLAAGLSAIFLAPLFAPIFARWRVTRWIGVFALASSDVLLRRSSGRYVLAIAIFAHMLTIMCIWSLGHAQGFGLSALDAAALFAVMGGVALIPITVGGWGLRELAVTALLQSHGVPLERALFFSVSFGLVILLASSVGAVVWAFYSPERTAPPAGRTVRPGEAGSLRSA